MAKVSRRQWRLRVRIPDEEIRYFSDFQLNWEARLEPLHQGRFSVENRSMHGDAPNSFIRVHTYTPGKTCHRDRPSTWPAFIAKVGSKWYPVESITEHLVTRLGQTCGVSIADSQLRIVGNQVLKALFNDERVDGTSRLGDPRFIQPFPLSVLRLKSKMNFGPFAGTTLLKPFHMTIDKTYVSSI